MAKHIFNKLITLVAVFGTLFDIAVVAGGLSDAEHAGFLVEHDIDILCGHMLFFHKERDDGRVDGTRTRTHHKTVKRRYAHSGIKRLAALNSGNRRTVAEMAGNDVDLLRLLAEHSGGTCRYIAVRGAVEAIAAKLVFLVVFIRNRIDIGIIRHGLVEAGIENADLRNLADDLFAGTDTGKVCRVVKRA